MYSRIARPGQCKFAGVRVRIWFLTFWPQGQCMPRSCHGLGLSTTATDRRDWTPCHTPTPAWVISNLQLNTFISKNRLFRLTCCDWLNWGFTSHSTQNRSFRRCSSQPISWLGTEETYCQMPTEYAETFFRRTLLRPASVFWCIHTSSHRFLAVCRDFQTYADTSTKQSPGF